MGYRLYGKRNFASDDVRHIYYIVSNQNKYLALKRIVDINPDIYGIIFCKTRKETREIAESLIQDGYNADALYGDLSQSQRESVMNRFRNRILQFLVATDIAARGIDVNDVTHVINYNIPDESEIYVHRSGRTGRAGNTGISVCIIHSRETRNLREFEKKIGKSFERIMIPSGEEVCEKKLFHFIEKVKKIVVDEQSMKTFLPEIQKKIGVTTFGESHGNALGGIIDGCPAGIELNLEEIQNELNRRRPGQSSIVTQRNEPDKVNFLSGILDNKTTGTPIGFIIFNKDHQSDDYRHIQNIYRPSHSDFTYEKKYGIRDYRGGGRSSARETICRVVAGSIAKQLIKDIKITSYVSSVGNISINKPYQDLDLSKIEENSIRCPDPYTAEKMISLIRKIKKKGDTIGGTITCVIKNVPVGIGEPVFNKLHAELAKAMLSINAVKGFEYGSGFFGSELTGSKHNDLFNSDGSTKTNFSGGILGGISWNGYLF
ncbi:hypothetical protein ANN_28146 [Periplaneta americana]|uniref:Chorismate synthase n=1 Tax=Periplaneta americana TaxID=6978 RepID=A0ABQ8T2R3_PERAM|nr:hypothetical protein ANN_28146 [Periplaneta americana]